MTGNPIQLGDEHSQVPAALLGRGWVSDIIVRGVLSHRGIDFVAKEAVTLSTTP